MKPANRWKKSWKENTTRPKISTAGSRTPELWHAKDSPCLLRYVRKHERQLSNYYIQSFSLWNFAVRRDHTNMSSHLFISTLSYLVITYSFIQFKGATFIKFLALPMWRLFENHIFFKSLKIMIKNYGKSFVNILQNRTMGQLSSSIWP